MNRALVVLSGGLDSCVALSLAMQQNDRIQCVSFYYGQRHRKELDAASAIADFHGLVHRVQQIELGKGGVLMHHGDEMPHATYEELKEAEGPSPTYVPYRNGTFLSLAASIALEQECATIYAGMHSEDAHNFAYPDCTPEFIGAMQNAIYIGTYFKVRLVCPFTYKSKADIVKLGIELGAPMHLSYSCYEGKETACGQCPTCVGRLEAFKANGVVDPIEYEFDKYRPTRGHMVAKASSELNAMLKKED